MKSFIFLLVVIVAVNSASVEEQWKEFKLKHGRVYKSLREEKLRFGIFKSNLQAIEDHNAEFQNGKVSYQLAVNKFADLTNEEFRQKYLNYKSPSLNKTTVFKTPLKGSAPDEIDWRNKNAVLSVKNQGECGGCWAFSATGALEGQNAIKHGKQVELSEQQLIDCSTDYQNQGCNGGYMEAAFEYVKDNFIDTEDSYPFTGSDGTCSSGSDSGVTVTGYVSVDSGEDNLKEAVGTVGPISVAIFADFIQFYSSGVFDNILCLGLVLDHGVLAVGYGSENNKDYWLVKNSWGSDWGESGYIKMVRNKFNQCGIANEPVYPVIQ